MEKKELKAIVKNVKGKLIAVASSEAEDRVGDVVKASGWVLNNFKKNPVLLFAHNYSQPPVGIAKNIKIVGKNLTFEPEFHEITQLAREIKAMFYAVPPIMKAFSVGFIPLKFNETNRKEIIKQELLEISAVPVPANAEALIQISKSCDVVDQVEIDKWLSKQKGVEEVANEKPYPNFHACRLISPDKFEAGSFRSTSRDSNGKKYNIIMGKLKGKTTMTEQGYRYPKEVWSASEAKAHCKEHKGILFEPASEKDSVCVECNESKEIEKKESVDKTAEVVMSEINDLKEEISRLKEGRVLSKKNKKVVSDAIASMQTAISALKDVLDSAEVQAEQEDVLESGEGKSIKGRREVARKSRKNLITVRALKRIAKEVNITLSYVKER